MGRDDDVFEETVFMIELEWLYRSEEARERRRVSLLGGLVQGVCLKKGEDAGED